MQIRNATLADINEITEIYESARIFMRECGNHTQWNGSGPSESTLRTDIASNASYVLVEDGEIVATFYFSTERDPNYEKIYDGAWGSDEPYAVIHRVAVKHRGRGLAAICFEYCKRRFPHLRIDTHRDNIPMQRTLAKAGFEYRGIIHLECGDERLAYEKT